MYAIRIYSHKYKGTDKDNEDGWFIRTKIHRGAQYDDPYNGAQRVEPVLTKNSSKARTWKTAGTAIEYAKGLARKFETIKKIEQIQPPFLHTMVYSIYVIDLETNSCIHRIQHSEYRAYW